jgi:MoaA/NifB/PqqE/SkfB family radical SAM enzyme
MALIPVSQGIDLAAGVIRSYVTKRPIAIAYEVTLSCNCNCRHCDLGGLIKDEKQIEPEDYGDLTQRFMPPVAQITGGESLLRKDIAAIVRAIKQGGARYIILQTNGLLLNESNYLELREEGVNQFSVSLDFPDERHDEFRGRPGLYKHLEQTLPRLSKLGFRDISLNTAITRANLRDILPLARKAADWGASISYSAYTELRTGNREYCLRQGEDLEILRQVIDKLVILTKQHIHVSNPECTLRATLKFFEQGYMPNCMAGVRFLVIMPDGSLVPCALRRSKYATRKEMVKRLYQINQCDSCYVAMRSYCEMSFLNHVRNIPAYLPQLAFHSNTSKGRS